MATGAYRPGFMMEVTMSSTATSRITEEVAQARAALLTFVQERPGPFTAYDLKTNVRNGWSAAAMALALRELLREGALESRGGEIYFVRAG
jgi:hypothetical protein